MKRTKKQLNAISRSYARKERERLQKILEGNNLSEQFAKSKYKTLRGFLKSKNLEV